MNKKELYWPHIEQAASGYAETIARSNRLPRISCSSVDLAIRIMAHRLVVDDVIDSETMLNFLKKHQYRENTPLNWWNE